MAGVDVFIETDQDPETIGGSLAAMAEGSAFTLTAIGSRGAQVWPATGGHSFLVDQFRARFLFRTPPEGDATTAITDLLQRIGREYRWMHLETLQRFDGVAGYSVA
ncbi:hypothetical protein ACFQU2_01955 [Siccirubricoccus deserti]